MTSLHEPQNMEPRCLIQNFSMWTSNTYIKKYVRKDLTQLFLYAADHFLPIRSAQQFLSLTD